MNPDMASTLFNHSGRRNTMSNSTNTPENSQNAATSTKHFVIEHTPAFVKLLLPDVPYDDNDITAVEYLTKLLLEISVLQKQLAYPSGEDLYFRLGIDSNKARLKSLQQKFKIFRFQVNTIDANLALEEIKNIDEKLLRFKGRYISFIIGFAINATKNRKRHLEMILRLKRIVGEIHDLKYYFKIVKKLK